MSYESMGIIIVIAQIIIILIYALPVKQNDNWKENNIICAIIVIIGLIAVIINLISILVNGGT